MEGHCLHELSDDYWPRPPTQTQGRIALNSKLDLSPFDPSQTLPPPPPRAAVASVQLKKASLNKECCVAVAAAGAGVRSGHRGGVGEIMKQNPLTCAQTFPHQKAFHLLSTDALTGRRTEFTSHSPSMTPNITCMYARRDFLESNDCLLKPSFRLFLCCRLCIPHRC